MHRPASTLALVLALLACGDVPAQAVGTTTPCVYFDRNLCDAARPLLLFLPGAQSAQSVANPIPTGKAFCLTAYVTAQSTDWAAQTPPAQPRGLFALGNYGSGNPSDNLGFFANTQNTGTSPFLEIYKGSSLVAGGQNFQSLANTRQQTATCYTPSTGFTIWTDGVNLGSSGGAAIAFTQPGTLYIGQLSGLGFGPYGTGLSDVCVAGWTGRNTGVITSDVSNACGQFTPASTGPCFGCVTPNVGATKVYALGDSITFGSGFRSYPAKLNALLGVTYAVTNAGVSGDNLAGMKVRYDATARNWARCIFLGGFNDVIFFGDSAATATPKATALLDEMRADGCKPIVIIPTPSKNNATLNWTAARETQFGIYRSNLASYCVTNAATTTCVDPNGAGPTTGMGDGTSPPQMYSGYDSGDHVHPSQAGSDKLASLVFAGATWP